MKLQIYLVNGLNVYEPMHQELKVSYTAYFIILIFYQERIARTRIYK